MEIKEGAEEYKILRDYYLNQYLNEKNRFLLDQRDYNDLIKHYQLIRNDLFNEQTIANDLNSENDHLQSEISKKQVEAENLKRENIHLKNVLKSYQSRKVVRFGKRLLKLAHPIKSFLIRSNSKIRAKKPVPKVDSKNTLQIEKHIKTHPKSETSKSKPKMIKDIKVAVILDEFSYNSFKYEFNAIHIQPHNWLEIFQSEKPDLFLCESAWSGGLWKGRIQFNGHNRPENRAILFYILDYCKENEIPTIFWNKEDPVNFQSFYDTALKFDHIFTTDEECTKIYNGKYHHESVHNLMFAAQPRIFNPIETEERGDYVTFAGSWYSRHTNRSYEMKKIFEKILESGLKLKIYDRWYNQRRTHPSHVFPDEYNEYINPPVEYNQVEKIYKESKYSLNINTVTNSNTMFARRALELMICNTLVLSNYSKGLHNIFGDNVIYIGKNKIDLEKSEYKRINNIYEVLNNHTYTNRFKEILDAIDYEYQTEEEEVTVYYTLDDNSDIDDVLNHFESITHPYKRVALLLSDEISNDKSQQIHNKHENEDIPVYDIKNLLNRTETIDNNTSNFIFANLQLEHDMIEKAILHRNYIENEFGIGQGNKFSFTKTKDPENILFSNNFMKVLRSVLNQSSDNFSIYNILI